MYSIINRVYFSVHQFINAWILHQVDGKHKFLFTVNYIRDWWSEHHVTLSSSFPLISHHSHCWEWSTYNDRTWKEINDTKYQQQPQQETVGNFLKTFKCQDTAVSIDFFMQQRQHSLLTITLTPEKGAIVVLKCWDVINILLRMLH